MNVSPVVWSEQSEIQDYHWKCSVFWITMLGYMWTLLHRISEFSPRVCSPRLEVFGVKLGDELTFPVLHESILFCWLRLERALKPLLTLSFMVWAWVKIHINFIKFARVRMPQEFRRLYVDKKERERRREIAKEFPHSHIHHNSSDVGCSSLSTPQHIAAPSPLRRVLKFMSSRFVFLILFFTRVNFSSWNYVNV